MEHGAFDTAAQPGLNLQIVDVHVLNPHRGAVGFLEGADDPAQWPTDGLVSPREGVGIVQLVGADAVVLGLKLRVAGWLGQLQGIQAGQNMAPLAVGTNELLNTLCRHGPGELAQCFNLRHVVENGHDSHSAFLKGTRPARKQEAGRHVEPLDAFESRELDPLVMGHGIVVDRVQHDLNEIVAAGNLQKDFREGSADDVPRLKAEQLPSRRVECGDPAFEVDAQDAAAHVLQNHPVNGGGVHRCGLPDPWTRRARRRAAGASRSRAPPLAAPRPEAFRKARQPLPENLRRQRPRNGRSRRRWEACAEARRSGWPDRSAGRVGS